MASLIKPGSLSTYSNELTDGVGLEVADNVVMDEPYVIEKRRGFRDGASLPLSTHRYKQLAIYKDRLITHYNDVLQFDSTGELNFSSFSGSFSETETGLRIKSKEANSNLYFTSSTGIKKISAKTASDLSTSSNYITTAGGVKAVDLEGKIAYSAAGFLPSKSKVAYFLVWGTKDLNNNVILGTPSSRLVITNNSVPVYVKEVSTITVAGALTSSQYILLSSKDVDYYVWFNNTGTDSKPQTSETINRTEIEVNLVGITTNDTRASAIGVAISNVSDFTVDVNSSVVTVTLADEKADNVIDISEQSGGTNNITVATLTQGSVTDGYSANVNLESLIPQDILNSSDPTNYFYQLYRTGVAQAPDIINLSEIDPGSEANQVYESYITSTDVSNGKISLTDITPENFREAGNFLYTNPVTGGGILSANERPPIAKDIELFRNYMFYANTKTLHRLTIDLLDVGDLTSNVSDFIIGNKDTTRTYTFQGSKESFTLTVDHRSATTSGGYINFSSANDTEKYTMWFDLTGSDAAPPVTDRQLIRVDISANAGVPNTTAGTLSAITTVLDNFLDFSYTTLGATITITNTNNGNSTNAVIASSLGGTWAISGIVNGTGEDTSTNKVLLSSLTSSSQAIEETARSLIKVINADSSSPVNAFYISSEDDLPGKILLESRSVEDIDFYVFTSDANISNNFNPELPLNETVLDITFSAGANSPAKIHATGHGLATGDELYIYNTATTPVIRGAYKITVLDADYFTIPFNITVIDNPSAALYVKTTNASDNVESLNRVYYSKLNQPEAVPLLNFIEVGPKDKAIKRILALRDSLFVLKEDGIYIVTGSSSPFNFRLLTSSSKLLAADSAVVLDNLIYCLTTQGVVAVSETGVSIISRDIENKITDFTRTGFNFSTACFGVSYESDRAYILFAPTKKSDTSSTQCYRYNTINQTWTRWTVEANCGLVSEVVNKMYLGASNRNILLEERKNGDRTDYADRDFVKSIVEDTANETTLEFTNTQDLEVFDTIYQETYIPISLFNRLLRKLDQDSGLDDSDYEASLKMSPTGNIVDHLNDLNQKLLVDDASGIVTDHTPFSANIDTQKTQFNSLIAELNGLTCDTYYKDYSIAEDLCSYEAIIQAIESGNKVTLNYQIPIVSGEVTIFKGIKSSVVFGPQTFGEPETMKQVREGSILLDQAQFYDAYIAFKSDISQSFSEIRVFGKGIGTWGYDNYGNFTFGGSGTDEGIRVIVPQTKQRCKYLQIRFNHGNAREAVRCLGISMTPRSVSTRAYR